jgi:choline dehydrogenase-like flavoprotein
MDEMVLGRSWDDIIVGAGSSGAVLASRLSEQPDRQVLLLEAGSDRDTAERPQPVGKPVLTGANWDYDAYVDTEGGRQFAYRVGKVMGGSSAVNGALAMRGLPADFDGWAEAGNPDWAWERVLPYFTRLEADADFKGPEHGTSGPLPIKRLPAAELNELADAFLRGCRALGLPDLPDVNSGPDIGVGPLPTNTVGGRRMSTAATYLAHARGRPNLTLLDNCHVTAVRFAGQRVTGIEMLRDGRSRWVRAGRVALCAGAVNTPGILQRSGIGDAGRLTALGICPLADRPGVGENLIDHPAVAIWALPKPGICEDGRPWHSAIARLAVDGPEADLTLSMLNNVATADVPMIGTLLGGRMAVTVAAMLLSPLSRGKVFLRDSAPDAKPVIVLGLACAPEDMKRLITGTRLAWSVVRSTPFAELVDRVVIWTDRMVSDDTMLGKSIERFVAPQWHPVGTARMGPATDNLAVVDQHCRVHGVDGLWVADASVMPTIPRAPTNLSCIMLGERAAEWVG